MIATIHFSFMIFASFILFFVVIRIVIGKQEFLNKRSSVILLSVIVVIVGMLMGKYGANWGLPWWIYYPLPLLLNVILPPVVLKMNTRQIILYIFLAIMSAPFIHIFFSFFLGWNEYLPFWKIPSIKNIF